jgi:hypothetical protein
MHLYDVNTGKQPVVQPKKGRAKPHGSHHLAHTSFTTLISQQYKFPTEPTMVMEA